MGLPQCITAAILMLQAPHCVLDGEAVGDVFHAFDLLAVGEVDFRVCDYATRYQQWSAWSICWRRTPFVTPTATTEADKRLLMQKLKAENREGIVFKDRSALYTPGRPASGGTQLKFKFVATASCIVAGANRNRRSVGLELIDADGKKVSAGNVTIPANQPIPGAGEIVEVRYL